MSDEHTRPLGDDQSTRPLDEDAPEPTQALPLQEHDAEQSAAEEHPPPQPAPWAPPPPESTGGRHPLSVAHLVAGLVFLGIATSWLLRETGVVDADGSEWFLPMTLVVAGAIGLLAWFSSARGKSR